MQFKKVLVGLLFASSAQAGDAFVSWTYPTSYEDGTILPITEVSEVTVYYGQTATGPYPNKKIILSPATNTIITNLGKGKWFFSATITATNGLESAQSIEVNKQVWGTSKPKPPVIQ